MAFHELSETSEIFLPHVPLTKPGLTFPSQSVQVELSPSQTPQESVFFMLFSTPSQPKKTGLATAIQKRSGTVNITCITHCRHEKYTPLGLEFEGMYWPKYYSLILNMHNLILSCQCAVGNFQMFPKK